MKRSSAGVLSGGHSCVWCLSGDIYTKLGLGTNARDIMYVCTRHLFRLSELKLWLPFLIELYFESLSCYAVIRLIVKVLCRPVFIGPSMCVPVLAASTSWCRWAAHSCCCKLQCLSNSLVPYELEWVNLMCHFFKSCTCLKKPGYFASKETSNLSVKQLNLLCHCFIKRRMCACNIQISLVSFIFIFGGTCSCLLCIFYYDKYNWFHWITHRFVTKSNLFPIWSTDSKPFILAPLHTFC